MGQQSLAGRVVMVTGGAQGIGAGIGHAMAGAGAAVAVCDLDADLAARTALELRRQGARALAVPTDVSVGASVRSAVARVEADLGGIDVLVNNAGIDKIEMFVDSEEPTWDRLIAVNLKGTLLCCRAVLDKMIERGSGRIINLGSDAGRVGSSGEAVYSATKGGVIAFTKTLAREVARTGITVNCVCPGPTDTKLLAQVEDFDPKLHASLARAIPLKRLGQPADIAALVAFLASDAAAYITGQTISVSGGLTMA
jgi:2-hydroxycyclohexanecarboxyl-CoA dehydrogenase